MKMIVFPHAGGFSITYHPFVKLLRGGMGVRLYDYSGHGARMDEPFNSSMRDVIREAAEFVREEMRDGQEVCLFGHSAGAIVAYEAAAALEQAGSPVERVVLSGHIAPDCPGTIPEDDGIDAYLMEMGGTSEAVLQSPDYRRYLYPVVQSDFHLLRGYACADPHPVLCRTRGMVLWGEEDPSVTLREIGRWKDFFAREPVFASHRGGHFYLYDCWEQVSDEIRAFVLQQPAACF